MADDWSQRRRFKHACNYCQDKVWRPYPPAFQSAVCATCREKLRQVRALTR